MMAKLLKNIFLLLIRIYRLCISPLLLSACRHEPTCSHYAAQAIREHGALSGTKLALKRLGKCHPWGTFGYDPVPRR